MVTEWPMAALPGVQLDLVFWCVRAYAMNEMHRFTPLGVGLLAALAIAAALLLASACFGGGGGDDGATPTPTAVADATTTPRAAAQPGDRPANFTAYPGVIATYLTDAGDAALEIPCLADLLAAWQMPESDATFLTPATSILDSGCLLANVDADADMELAVTLTAEPEGDHGFGLFSNLVVFDRRGDAFVVAFESAPPGGEYYPELAPVAVLSVDDINADGIGDLTYVITTCGASTCTHTVHAVSGVGGSVVHLTPDDGLSMSTADISFSDADADGIVEIVLSGGYFGSVGAGVQRGRTETYAWNGELYELAETVYEPSDLLYFAIIDADSLFDDGLYLDAAQAYGAALASSSLQETGMQENERAELSAYATFRAGLAQLANGGSILYAYFPEDDLGILNNTLSTTFAPAYEASGDLHTACLAVRNHIAANEGAFYDIWQYGYANPEFNAENVCPF